MLNFNNHTIVGRLGQDPDGRVTQTGMAIVELRVATNRYKKGAKEGEFETLTDWHSVKLFGNLAERFAARAKKGSLVLITGSSTTESWEGKDGVKRYKTILLADKAQVISENTDAPKANPSPGPVQPQEEPKQKPVAEHNVQSAPQPTSTAVPQTEAPVDDSSDLPF